MRARYILAAAFWLAGLLWHAAAQPRSKQPPPRLMLWSWYAEDDFRPLAGRGLGVAYLALSLRLERQNTVTPNPRANSLRIPPNMYRMAVVRFDYSVEGPDRPAFSPRQRELAVRMIGEIVVLSRAQSLQVDFDAPQSAWPFYRQLLSEVRARVGSEVFLSITALVSWCGSAQSWLAGLPVDEMVPMGFSMGRSAPAVMTMFQRGGHLEYPACRASLGVELPSEWNNPNSGVRPHQGQRAYFFPGVHQWSPELVAEAEKSILP